MAYPGLRNSADSGNLAGKFTGSLGKISLFDCLETKQKILPILGLYRIQVIDPVTANFACFREVY